MYCSQSEFYLYSLIYFWLIWPYINFLQHWNLTTYRTPILESILGPHPNSSYIWCLKVLFQSITSAFAYQVFIFSILRPYMIDRYFWCESYCLSLQLGPFHTNTRSLLSPLFTFFLVIIPVLFNGSIWWLFRSTWFLLSLLKQHSLYRWNGCILYTCIFRISNFSKKNKLSSILVFKFFYKFRSNLNDNYKLFREIIIETKHDIKNYHRHFFLSMKNLWILFFPIFFIFDRYFDCRFFS